MIDLLQPFFDVSKAHALAGDGGDLLLHRSGDLPDEGSLLPHRPVHRHQDGPLEGSLLQGGGVVAVPLAVVQAAHTPPHNAGLIAPLPGTPTVEGPTFAADQPLRKGVLAGVGGEAGRGCLSGAFGRFAPRQLRLDSVEGLVIYYGRVVILNEVLGQLPGVPDGFLADTVADEGLLQKDIPAVLLVGEDVSDGAGGPLGFPGHIEDIFVYLFSGKMLLFCRPLSAPKRAQAQKLPKTGNLQGSNPAGWSEHPFGNYRWTC